MSCFYQKELLPAEYFCFQKAQKIAHFNALPHTQFCTILFYAVVIPWVMERPQLMQMHCISITTVVVVSGVPSSKTYLLLSCPWTKIMNTVFNWIKKILKSSHFALQNIKGFKQKWYFVLLCECCYLRKEGSVARRRKSLIIVTLINEVAKEMRKSKNISPLLQIFWFLLFFYFSIDLS